MYFSNDWIYDACEGILRIQRSEIGMKRSWDVCHLAIIRHVPDPLRSLNRSSSLDDEDEKLVLMVPTVKKLLTIPYHIINSKTESAIHTIYITLIRIF